MAVYTTIYSTTNLTVRHIFGQFGPFGIRRWLFRLLKSLILRHKKQFNTPARSRPCPTGFARLKEGWEMEIRTGEA